jgi:pimeloyl-ACP methyl ester carboxylesterase
MQMTKTAWLALMLVLAPAAQATAGPAAATRVVETGGRRIFFHDIAGRRPVIVLDAGGGQDASYWDGLAAELAQRTGSRVITYDRAGMGLSDDVPGPWRVQAAVDDLAIGLKRLGATREVILVSHSLAGEIATYLARRHPAWLRGVVMVDANVPQFFTDATVTVMYAAQKPMIDAMAAAPPTPQSRQMVSLAASWVETSHAFHRTAWPAKVRCAVIVSEKTPLDSPDGAKAWRDAEAEFARTACRRPVIVAERSSHDVAHDRPDVIIQAIAEMAARGR